MKLCSKELVVTRVVNGVRIQTRHRCDKIQEHGVDEAGQRRRGTAHEGPPVKHPSARQGDRRRWKA